MSTDLDRPTLDALHAEATPGPWVASQMGPVWRGPLADDEPGFSRGKYTQCHQLFEIESDVYDLEDEDIAEEQKRADSEWIAAIHNAYPALSARIREQDALLEEYRYANEGQAQALRDATKRIVRLEETLRGIRQEKQQAHDACVYDPIDADRLKEQIDQIDRVLKGEL